MTTEIEYEYTTPADGKRRMINWPETAKKYHREAVKLRARDAEQTTAMRILTEDAENLRNLRAETVTDEAITHDVLSRLSSHWSALLWPAELRTAVARIVARQTKVAG